MDIEKVHEFNFLKEEVEEFRSRRNQNLVSVRTPSYLKQKNFEYCLGGINILYVQFFIRRW